MSINKYLIIILKIGKDDDILSDIKEKLCGLHGPAFFPVQILCISGQILTI